MSFDPVESQTADTSGVFENILRWVGFNNAIHEIDNKFKKSRKTHCTPTYAIGGHPLERTLVAPLRSRGGWREGNLKHGTLAIRAITIIIIIIVVIIA